MKGTDIIGFVGIGLFILAGLQGLSSLVFSILRDVFIALDIPPMINYSLNKFLALCVFLLVFNLIIGRIKNISFFDVQSIKKLLTYSIGFYVLTQALGFFQPIVSYNFYTLEYLEDSSLYHTIFSEKDQLTTGISTVFWVVKYVVVAIILFRNINYSIDDFLAEETHIYPKE